MGSLGRGSRWGLLLNQGRDDDRLGVLATTQSGIVRSIDGHTMSFEYIHDRFH